MLLDDNGPGQYCIIIVGTGKNDDAFGPANTVLGDGTFRMSPSLWEKKKKLHVNKSGFILHCCSVAEHEDGNISSSVGHDPLYPRL